MSITPELQQKWANRGFNHEEVQEWIKVGLSPNEVDLVAWLRYEKNREAEDLTDLEQLRQEYSENANAKSSEEYYGKEEVNVQEWLNREYQTKEKKENTKEIYINKKELEGELDLSEFAKLERIYLSYFVNKNKLDIKDEQKYKDKIIKLVSAQEYLEKEYPKGGKCERKNDEKNKNKSRKQIKELDISKENLEGPIKLEKFINLNKLNCSQNQLTELDISDCSKLVEIDCWNNQLTSLKFSDLLHLQILNAWDNQLTNLDWEKIGPDLTVISLSNNNFSNQELSCFNRFANLEELYLGTDKKERIKNGFHNRFNGSLKHLNNFKRLEKLQIEATNINSGLEFLPDSLERIVHWGSHYYDEKDFEVKKIEDVLEDYKEGEDQEYYNCKKWKKDRRKWEEKGFKDEELKHLEKIGIKMNDHEFAEHLISIDKEVSIEEWVDKEVSIEEWVDHFYPFEKRENINVLSINNNKIKGSLKLDGNNFKNLRKIDLRCKELQEIKLFDLTELGTFRANPCRLTKLVIKNCPKIINLNVANNLLEDLSFLNDLKESELKVLSIHSNNFSEKSLRSFSKFVELEQLFFDNCDREKFEEEKYNKFSGSLEQLENLKKLKYLSISNTDIVSGLKYLSGSVRRIGCISKWKREEKNGKGTGFFKIRRKLEKQEQFLTDEQRGKIYREEKNDNIPHYIITGYQMVVPFEKSKSPEENISLLNSSPALHEEWEIRGFTCKEIKNWIEAGFSPYEAPYVNEWEERGFTCEKVKKWREAGLESDDYEFAYYLKEEKDYEENNTSNLDLYNLWKDYEKGQKTKSSQLVKTVAEIPCGICDKLPIKESKNFSDKFVNSNYNKIYPERVPGEKFSWKKRDEAIDLPTKLYNIKRHQSDKIIVDDIIKASVERTKLDSDIKSYAILSYVCGPYSCIHENCRKCSGYIYQGLKGALTRAVEVLKLINEKKCQELKESLISENSNSKEIEEKVKNFSTLDYLWIDQFCIDQGNPHEKAEEIHKMHQYYSNAEVTLVPIRLNAKEEVEDFNGSFNELLRFFESGGHKKGKGISKKINEKIEELTRNVVTKSLAILKKIVVSEWFKRSWTFQEGWLSKRTLFMFNDCLVDGRFLALMWSLSHDNQFKETNKSRSDNDKTLWKNAIFWEGEEKKKYDDLEKFWEERFSNAKIATPIGWVYYKDDYNQKDIVYLSLNEALKEMKSRKRSVAIDGIYSILSLLPYGQKVEIEYSKNPNHQYTKNELRKSLTDVMKAAINAGYAEPLAWYGQSSRIPGLCWTPQINSNGSTSIENYIKVDCVPERIKFKPEGMEVIGSELIIGSVGEKKVEEEDNNFRELEIGVDVGELEDKKINIKGTKEVIEALEKGNVLVVFSKSEWKSNKPFALLVTGGEDNIRHRVGLVELLKGEENLRGTKRKKLVIGLDKFSTQEKKASICLENKTFNLEDSNQIQQQQAQIQIPPK